MPTASKVLANRFRLRQARLAAIVAAAVASLFRSKVDINNPRSVEAWLDKAIPLILAENEKAARAGARYATQARQLEIPQAPKLTFDPAPTLTEPQLRRSLQVVGPETFLKKQSDIRTLDVPPQQRKALIAEAKKISVEKVAAAAVRHVQNGARDTIIAASKRDTAALGYVRVTKAKPCSFCAMLASRGLVFAEDSFDLSDPRFTGTGTAKVHDSCQCGMKVVYTRDDEVLADAEVFTDMWSRWGAGGGRAALRFRRGYEHWVDTGEYLDWDIVDDIEKFRAR